MPLKVLDFLDFQHFLAKNQLLTAVQLVEKSRILARGLRFGLCRVFFTLVGSMWVLSSILPFFDIFTAAGSWPAVPNV